jgi:hypothetical protein
VIFGVSHIVAASAVETLPPCPQGWREEFSCHGEDVHPGKAAYLSTPRETHDFALFRAAGAGPAVEIVSYRETSSQRGCYHVAFGDAAMPDAIASALGGDAQSWAWPGTADVESLGDREMPPAAVAFAAGDLAAAIEFWGKGLGFGLIESNERHAVMRPPALSPNWRMDIVLVASGSGVQRDGMLDDAGWNCISLLTSKLETAAARALAHGGKQPTDRWSQLVDGRLLDIQFIRGPGGEVIELLDSNSAMKRNEVK